MKKISAVSIVLAFFYCIYWADTPSFLSGFFIAMAVWSHFHTSDFNKKTGWGN